MCNFFDDYDIEDDEVKIDPDKYSPRTGEYYMKTKIIHRGDWVRLGDKNPLGELYKIFGVGMVKGCKSITHCDFNCKAIVYETEQYLKDEMATYDLYEKDEMTSINQRYPNIPNSKEPSDVLMSKQIPDEDNHKRAFFNKLFNVKSTRFPVFHLCVGKDCKLEYIEFDGVYELYKIESALTQSIIMKKVDKTYLL